MNIFKKIEFFIIWVVFAFTLFFAWIFNSSFITLLIYLSIFLIFLILFYLTFIYFNKNKKQWIKFLLVFFNLILLCLFSIFHLFILISIILNNLTTPQTPNIQKYTISLENITENQYSISHFPNKIPNEAENYYFFIDQNFQGYNIHYLKFNINDKYLKNVLKENKDNICRKLEYKDITKYYKHINNLVDYNNKDKNSYTAYFLKNQNKDPDYISGFLISYKTKEIIYFYANWNLLLEEHKNKLCI